VAQRREIRRFEGLPSRALHGAFSPDGRHVAGVGYGGILLVWDAETGEVVFEFSHPEVAELATLAYSPDGATIVVTTRNVVFVVDAQTGAEIRRIDHDRGLFSTVVFAPDGQSFFGGAYSGALVQFAVASGEVVRNFPTHDGGIYEIAIDADRNILFSTVDTGLVRLWDIATGIELRQLRASSRVWAITLLPDDTVLLSTSMLNLQRWEIPPIELADLIAWVREHRYVRDLTCQERIQYRAEPYCEETSESTPESTG